MAKRVPIPTKAAKTPADEFVAQKPADTSGEPIIRLSVDLPESVHTKLKLVCVGKRMKMAEQVRRLIENYLEAA